MRVPIYNSFDASAKTKSNVHHRTHGADKSEKLYFFSIGTPLLGP